MVARERGAKFKASYDGFYHSADNNSRRIALQAMDDLRPWLGEDFVYRMEGVGRAIFKRARR